MDGECVGWCDCIYALSLRTCSKKIAKLYIWQGIVSMVSVGLVPYKAMKISEASLGSHAEKIGCRRTKKLGR